MHTHTDVHTETILRNQVHAGCGRHVPSLIIAQIVKSVEKFKNFKTHCISSARLPAYCKTYKR